MQLPRFTEVQVETSLANRVRGVADEQVSCLGSRAIQLVGSQRAQAAPRRSPAQLFYQGGLPPTGPNVARACERAERTRTCWQCDDAHPGDLAEALRRARQARQYGTYAHREPPTRTPRCFNARSALRGGTWAKRGDGATGAQPPGG